MLLDSNMLFEKGFGIYVIQLMDDKSSLYIHFGSVPQSKLARHPLL